MRKCLSSRKFQHQYISFARIHLIQIDHMPFLNFKQASAAASGDLNSVDSEVVIISADPTTTARPATTTPFVQRSVLKDFDNCGVKGSSNRVIGGAEVKNILSTRRFINNLIYGQVVENEYPWLCSLKYRGNHICGMTLLSGPPHDTILV